VVHSLSLATITGSWLGETHLCKLAQHGPWPIRKWLNRDHVWWGRLKPGCQIVRSVTTVWLTTEANDQFSLHCIIALTDVMSDHIGHRDASRASSVVIVLITVICLAVVQYISKSYDMIYDRIWWRFYDITYDNQIVCWFVYTHEGAVAESYLLHIRVGAHVMFHRLYGMYPCHFLTFLRSVYGRPENLKPFKDVILVSDLTC